MGYSPAQATTCQSGGALFKQSDIVWSKHHKTHLYCAGDDQWRYLAQWGLTGQNNLTFMGNNVGIGTVNPQFKLHVHGNLAVDNALGYGSNTHINMVTESIEGTGTVSDAGMKKGWGIHARGKNYADESERHDMGISYYNGTTWKSLLFMEHDTGNVGIGTRQPRQDLHVANGNEQGGGNQTVAQFGTGSGALFLTHTGAHVSGNVRYDDGQWRYEGNGGGGAIAFGTDGRVHLMTVPTGAAGSTANLKVQMTVTADGNVGIGADMPVSPLEIVFDNRPAGISNDVVIRRLENTDDWSPITFIRSRGTLHNPLPLQYGDALGGLLDQVVVNGSDKNGASVGSIHSMYKGNGTSLLSETRITTSTKLGILITDATTPSRIVVPAMDGTGYSSDWPAGWAGGIATWDIVGAGTYFSQYLTRSDRRYKKDIKAIEKQAALDTLMKLEPVSYQYKDGYGGRGKHYGFIAQDVQKIMPDLVTAADTPDQRLGLEYQGLIAPIIAAIQELKAENDALRAEIEDMKSMQK